MAKKNDLLGGFLDALSEGGSDILGELLEQVTGSKEAASIGGELLEGLSENSGSILENLGDVVADLTGIGAENTKASDVAKLSGKTKSSSTAKKAAKKTSAKKPAAAKKTTAAKKPAAAKKTTAEKKTTAASKPRSSAAKKKTI